MEAIAGGTGRTGRAFEQSRFFPYPNNAPIPLCAVDRGEHMAPKNDGTMSDADRQRTAWKKAQKLIAQEKPEDALLLLREVDENGTHHTTLRLAGRATHAIAQQTQSNADYRKAASLLREAVNMNPKDKKATRAHNDLLNEMLEKGIRRRSLRNVGYGMTVVATLLLIVGTVGIPLEVASREAPLSPPSFTQGAVFFGPEPLRENPVPLLASAEINVRWDRDDVFFVIADEEKKAECDSILPIDRMLSTNQTCKAEDSDYKVVGQNGTAGLTWTVERGVHYIGIGSLGESNPNGEGFTLDVSLELSLAAGGYVITFVVGVVGIRLVKKD